MGGGIRCGPVGIRCATVLFSNGGHRGVRPSAIDSLSGVDRLESGALRPLLRPRHLHSAAARRLQDRR